MMKVEFKRCPKCGTICGVKLPCLGWLPKECECSAKACGNEDYLTDEEFKKIWQE